MEDKNRYIEPMPTPLEPVSLVILADGEYPSGELARATIERAERVVCCDGASVNYLAHGGVPFAIVGDGDSLPMEIREKYGSILHLKPEDQETNDLTKGVEFAIAQGFRRIVILGATGRREDHTIANVALLSSYSTRSEIEHISIITDSGVFTPVNRNSDFESWRGQQVSIFSMDTATKLTTQGLDYPLTNEALVGWWSGTLNSSAGSRFSIETDGRLVVYRLFERESKGV